MNIGDWIEEKSIENGDKPALMFKDDKISYKDLNRSANKAANMLHTLGVRKGDRVAIVMGNCPQYIYLLFGAAKIGAICACVNPMYRGQSLAHLINSCDSEILIISQDIVNPYIAISNSLTQIKQVIWNPDVPNGVEKGVSFPSLFEVSSDDKPPKVEVLESDFVSLLHTSGTYGLGKWCIHTHNSYINAASFCANRWGLVPQDRIISGLPICHLNPQFLFFMPGIEANATLIMLERFSASTFWEQVKEYKATVIVLHPGVQGMLMKQPIQEGEKDHSVRMIFAVHRGMMERYNISVGFTLYGSTEGVINTMNRFTLPISDKFESVELPLSSICGRVNSEFCEIMIADENTREVPYGTEGEILVRSRKPHVMFEGYYGMPEKTVEAFRSFWYHTGDRGFIDREGILYFCGRMAEGIKVKGEWVATLELEMLFRRHPKVFDCAVVGFPAELVDEDIKIYIQLKEGESMAPEEVIAYCEGKIARFMIPRYIEFVKEFPRAFADKIQKVELKKRGIGKCWDREKGWL